MGRKKLDRRKSIKWIRRLRIILSFSHIRTCFAIIICAVLSLFVSYLLNENNPFFASILSNVFAGFLTGLVLCIIGGVKQITIVKMQETKSWLEQVQDRLNDYRKAHHEIRKLKYDKFDGDESLFNIIYDCGCRAVEVNSLIIQSAVSKTLSFDSLKLCRNKFEYDPYELEKTFEELHYKLTMIDVDYPSKKEICHYFDEVSTIFFKLNTSIKNEIKSIEIREKVMKNMII